MGIYEPKKINLPSGLDEIALERSLFRLPNESLEDFKRRLLLEYRDPVDNSIGAFKKSPTRQVGLPDIAVAKLTTELARPRLLITSTKLYWWNDYLEDPVLELELNLRDGGGYFLSDVFASLTTLGVVDIEILDSDYAYRFSRNLQLRDSSVNNLAFLSENYVNKLNETLVGNLKFSDSLVFATLKNNPDELSETGDYYVDETNGVIFSFDLQHGYVNFDYVDFPLILWWSPVRVFELNDSDTDYLIKDTLILDGGTLHKNLNRHGARYVNELLATHTLEWAS